MNYLSSVLWLAVLLDEGLDALLAIEIRVRELIVKDHLLSGHDARKFQSASADQVEVHGQVLELSKGGIGKGCVKDSPTPAHSD